MRNRGPGALESSRLLTIGFAVVCLFTSIVYTGAEGEPLKKTLPITGGLVGPITTTTPNTVLLVRAGQSLQLQPGGTWSAVEGEVLDDDDNHLFSFSEELWEERGSDWHESKEDFDVKFTLPEPGAVTFEFSTENSSPKVVGPLLVEIERKRGSTVPHFAAGLLGLLLGAGMLVKGS